MAEQRVTVYHGTSADRRARIEKEGLISLFGRGGYVFVADNRERAMYYARPATAHAMTPCTFDGYWPPEHDLGAPPVGEPVGLIVTAEVPERRLKDDPYNPEKEPGQYSVHRGIKREWIVGFEEVEFSQLRDPGERSLTVVLWLSIQRSLWEGRKS